MYRWSGMDFSFRHTGTHEDSTGNRNYHYDLDCFCEHSIRKNKICLERRKIMNHLRSILSKVAVFVLFAATLSAGTASCFGAYQPEAPEELQK